MKGRSKCPFTIKGFHSNLPTLTSSLIVSIQTNCDKIWKQITIIKDTKRDVHFGT